MAQYFSISPKGKLFMHVQQINYNRLIKIYIYNNNKKAYKPVLNASIKYLKKKRV